MTMKLFTKFGALIHQAHVPELIEVPEAVRFRGRHFHRDFHQPNEYQRYTEVPVHELKDEENP